MDILIALEPAVIRLPKSENEWNCISAEFEKNCGFPDIAGAIDGSIFEIERPYEYDGWICRKGFSAINMQATVDSEARFMEFSLRPGSCSDKNLWKMSSLGSRVRSILPTHLHFIGDAGLPLLLP